MKSTRALLVRAFAAAAALHAATLAFLGLPALSGVRESIAEPLGLAPDGLWLPLMLLSLGVSAALLARAAIAIARPLEELKRQIDAGWAAPRSRRSGIAELATLERHLEANVVRAQEAQRQLEDVEQELAAAKQSLAEARSQTEAGAAEIAALLAARKSLALDNERLSASVQSLRESLDLERQAKVGAEVQKRADEIYAQLERAVSASALRSLWLPSLVRALEAPARVIRRSAAALSENWRQSSLEQLEREVETIARQTQIQLDLIDGVLIEKKFPPLSALIPEPEAAEEESAPPSEPEPERPAAAAEPAERDFPPPPKPEAASRPRIRLEPAARSEPPPEPAAAPRPEPPAPSEPWEEPRALDLSEAPRPKPEPAPDAAGSSGAIPADAREEVAEPEADDDARAPTLAEIARAAAETAGLPSDAVGFEVELGDGLAARRAPEEALAQLIEALVELAAGQLSDGTVALAVHEAGEALAFEIVSEGEFDPEAEPPDLVRPQKLALDLETDLEVESAPGELRIAFGYEPPED